MNRPNRNAAPWLRVCSIALHSFLVSSVVGLTTAMANASPYGTWLSKPQIMFHLSNGTLEPAMARMKAQRYSVVFLDFRHVSDQDQQRVAQIARQSQLIPITWIQSPQYRSLSVEQLMDEGRYTNGIQVDDHFFSNYSPTDFQALRSQYSKLIFCSIQPFQAAIVPRSGCNKLDVQCYSSKSFRQCLSLADRLGAITSLSTENTWVHRDRMGGRSFNVFLWPHSDEFVNRNPEKPTEVTSWNTVE